MSLERKKNLLYSFVIGYQTASLIDGWSGIVMTVVIILAVNLAAIAWEWITS